MSVGRNLRVLGAVLAIAVWSGCQWLGCEPSAPGGPDGDVALQPERARLVSAQGEVTLTRGGTTAPAQPGPLRLRDVVETGAGGTAEIRFSDGRAVTLGENGRLVLDEENGVLVLNLGQGALLSRIPADAADGGGGVAVFIRTPYGLTRLGGGGNEVEVAVTEQGGRINVLVGRVELVGRDGKVTAAEAGERLELTGGKVELISRTPAEKPPLTLETIQVLVSGGGAEVKPQGAARWRKVAAKGETLLAGSALRSTRTPVKIALGGARSSVELQPSSEVLFSESGRLGTREESKLELRRGRLVHVARPGNATALTLPDLSVAGDGKGTRYEVRRVGAVIELRAVAGDLKISREGKEEAVRAGTRVALKAGTAAQPLSLESSALKLPTRSGQRVFHSGMPEVTLGWPGEAGDYEVAVAEDAAFEQILVEGLVHGPAVNVPAPRRGGLFWRVKGADGQEVKGSALFAPETSASDLQRLRNEVPDGAEKTTIFYQDKPPSVTFTFNPVEEAANYKLAIFKVTELKTPVAERETTETRIKLDEGALAEGSYVWSITATSAAGAVLPNRGRMNKLEMVYDNAVPALVILAPRNGDSSKQKVIARGIAPLGSRVYINGKPAALDEKGRFDGPAFPQGTPPVIIFKLSRPGEADSLTVRTLR